MTTTNPTPGNALGLSAPIRTPREYEFGTFKERLDHFCALFEIDQPQIEYEDGEPLLTAPLMNWVKANNANSDWLFIGSPCALLREWAKGTNRKSNRDEAKATKVNTVDLGYDLEALLRILALAADGEQIAGKTLEQSGGGTVIRTAADMAGQLVEALEKEKYGAIA